jgi:peroxiredoxin
MLIVLLLIGAMFSCGEKDQFVLNGHIKGVSDDKLVLQSVASNGKDVHSVDTVDVIAGDFIIRRSELETGKYVLTLLNSKLKIFAFLENGDISLEADIKNAQNGFIRGFNILGAKNMELFNQFTDMESVIIEQSEDEKIKQAYQNIQSIKDRKQHQIARQQLNELYPELNNEIEKARLKLLKDNIDQFFVPEVFPVLKMSFKAENIKEIYNLLPAHTKQHPKVSQVMKQIKSKELIQPGKQAPDFTLKTVEGKELSLSDLRGKIVLIDFWASWCKPCRASFPHMKDLYQKYHSKGFEILGVTNDKNRNAWLKAIKTDELPWLNVEDEFPGGGQMAKTVVLYGVEFLPTTILIDRDGKIVTKKLHGKALDIELKKIFGF